jgi:hypothetical protein
MGKNARTAAEVEAPKPWEQQLGESAPAFAAFKVYRDMGSSRSQVKVAEKLGKTRQLLSQWSMKHSWMARVRAWEREQDRLTLEAVQKRHRTALQNAIVTLSQPVLIMQALLKQEPMLAEDLALSILQSSPHARLAQYDRLMNLIARSSGALPSLIQAERLVNGVSTQNVAVAETEDGFGRSDDVARDEESARLARSLVARTASRAGDAGGTGLAG